MSTRPPTTGAGRRPRGGGLSSARPPLQRRSCRGLVRRTVRAHPPGRAAALVVAAHRPPSGPLAQVSRPVWKGLHAERPGNSLARVPGGPSLLMFRGRGEGREQGGGDEPGCGQQHPDAVCLMRPTAGSSASARIAEIRFRLTPEWTARPVHDHRRQGLADFPRRSERPGEPAPDPGHHHAGPRQIRAARRFDGHLATGRTRLTRPDQLRLTMECRRRPSVVHVAQWLPGMAGTIRSNNSFRAATALRSADSAEIQEQQAGTSGAHSFGRLLCGPAPATSASPATRLA
jgi:hypothetical protein